MVGDRPVGYSGRISDTPTSDSPAPAAPGHVDFHFDIMCPYAYQTSLWMREVRDTAGIEVSWRFFSLEEINRAEGKKHPWEREWSYGWSMMRIGALLRRTDMDLLDQWYQAAGHALHVEGKKPHRPEVAEELLGELGLDPGLVRAAIEDPTTGDEVHAEHDAVVAKGAFGVPTLVFPDGQAIFGPVLIDPPRGDAAVRLWQNLTGWLEFPHLYEVQRPKRPADIEAIATTFSAYLNARDWFTITNRAP
jgi:2-hydroxychromene-2-carboxylate isomerase